MEGTTGEGLWYAEGLAEKFFCNGMSILYLSRGTRITDFPKINFIDLASIDVLARAAYETYLIFHYIFYSPNDIKEQSFRYWVWRAAGLAERQHQPLEDEVDKQKLVKEKGELKEIREKLISNAKFKELGTSQQKKILDYLDKGKGDWKLQNWREIAESAGIHKTLSSYYYQHLCGYAHSGFVSVMQIREWAKIGQKPQLFRASMNDINIATANLIREYCDLFPRSKSALHAEPGRTDIIDMWVQIGQTLA